MQTTIPAWHASVRPSNATAAVCGESWHAPTNDSSEPAPCTFARFHFLRFQRYHARQFFHVHLEFMLRNVASHLHVCVSRRSVVRQRPRYGRISASTHVGLFLSFRRPRERLESASQRTQAMERVRHELDTRSTSPLLRVRGRSKVAKGRLTWRSTRGRRWSEGKRTNKRVRTEK